MTEDHIDRFLKRLADLPPGVEIDLEVEGLVDRVNGISRRIKNALKETLAEHGLTPQEWGVLTNLMFAKDHRSSPGSLAAELELSSGAMTSRLDGLEETGLVRRLQDPEDRRAIVVELTEKGSDAWGAAANVQARREAFFASALTKREQQQLNTLLRKLMLAFEAREPAKEKLGGV